MNDEQLHAAAGEPGNNAAGRDGGTTALRIFEQANGMNDFPVLKAFQEYIEAEQARARKRTLGLSIFFVVLLIVVVVTFSVIMAAVINRDQQSLQAIATRNQALSDKLLDIALRERTPAAQPVVNVQQPPTAHPDTGAQAQALKPVLDRLESLTEALKKQPVGTTPQPVPVVLPMPPAAQRPVVVSPELDAARRQQDELARQRAAVAAERARLKEEQEQLRRDRIEQHRRRLYPEYYAREDAQKAAAEVPPPPPRKGTTTALPKPPPAVVPAKPPVAEPPPPPPAPAPVAKPKPVAQPKPAPVAATPKPKVVEAPAVDLKTAKPISYFDEAEDAPQPVSTNAPSAVQPDATERVPPVSAQNRQGAVQPDATERVPPVSAQNRQGAARPDATERVPPVSAQNRQGAVLPGGTGSVPSATTKVVQPPPKKQTDGRTEVLNVGTKDGEAIPWLIELPEGKDK